MWIGPHGFHRYCWVASKLLRPLIPEEIDKATANAMPARSIANGRFMNGEETTVLMVSEFCKMDGECVGKTCDVFGSRIDRPNMGRDGANVWI